MMEPNYKYAREMARKILKDYSLKSVPTDLKKIFDALGFEYVELDDPEDVDGMIVKVGDKPSIVVINVKKPLARQRFTLAHELGHLFLNHNERDMYDAETAREQSDYFSTYNKAPKEIEADVFASELLIPFEHIKKYHDRISDIEWLSQTFQVSKAAMIVAIENYLRRSRKRNK